MSLQYNRSRNCLPALRYSFFRGSTLGNDCTGPHLAETFLGGEVKNVSMAGKSAIMSGIGAVAQIAAVIERSRTVCV